jgi:hypothetical protein
MTPVRDRAGSMAATATTAGRGHRGLGASWVGDGGRCAASPGASSSALHHRARKPCTRCCDRKIPDGGGGPIRDRSTLLRVPTLPAVTMNPAAPRGEGATNDSMPVAPPRIPLALRAHPHHEARSGSRAGSASSSYVQAGRPDRLAGSSGNKVRKLEFLVGDALAQAAGHPHHVLRHAPVQLLPGWCRRWRRGSGMNAVSCRQGGVAPEFYDGTSAARPAARRPKVRYLSDAPVGCALWTR